MRGGLAESVGCVAADGFEREGTGWPAAAAAAAWMMLMPAGKDKAERPNGARNGRQNRGRAGTENLVKPTPQSLPAPCPPGAPASGS